VENCVDKYVDNGGIKWYISNQKVSDRYIHRVISGFLVRFPQIFDGKRYKLINFAPKLEMVDNYASKQTISKLVSTAGVNNKKPQWYNLSGKKKSRKFCTYQRPIILFISFF
jgi:hypothetical protein